MQLSSHIVKEIKAAKKVVEAKLRQYYQLFKTFWGLIHESNSPFFSHVSPVNYKGDDSNNKHYNYWEMGMGGGR